MKGMKAMKGMTVTTADIARYREIAPGVFGPPPHVVRLRLLFGLAFGAFCLYALWRTGLLDVARIIDGVGKLGFLVNLMMPPAHNGDFFVFLGGIAETLAMAFLGTLGAAILALPLGFIAAKNVVANRIVHFVFRRWFDGIRGVDQLIWALVFINVVGLGPFAGILAIIVADTGTLGKLFSEAVENVEKGPVDGVRASGGARLAEARFGLLPQVFPVLVSQTLYFFESNTRSATILGIVGAGGIGLQLSDRIRVNNWDEAAFIIGMILVTVAVIDACSKRLRERLIGTRR